MRKIIFLLSICFALILCSCAGRQAVQIDGADTDGFVVEKTVSPTPVPTLAPEERDFRGMKWGMTLSDVTAIEGEGYTTVKEGVIRYSNLEVADLPMESEYTFEGGKLATCIYYSTHFHADTNDFIDDYSSLLERYKKKYKEPQYSEKKWSEGAETEDSSKFAKALEEGIMMYRTGWEFGNTRVNLVLFKDTDSKIKIGIRYQAIDINAKGDVTLADDGDI